MRAQWVRDLCAANFNLTSWTNNRVESHNQKIKTAVTQSTKLHKLFNALLNLQASKSVECSYTHAVAVSKIRYRHDNGSSSVASVIDDICTPYAADFVLKQLDAALKSKGTATVHLLDNEAFVNLDSTSCYIVDIANMTCNCVFSTTTRLPRKHIFLYRGNANMALISADIIPQWWHKNIMM